MWVYSSQLTKSLDIETLLGFNLPKVLAKKCLGFKRPKYLAKKSLGFRWPPLQVCLGLKDGTFAAAWEVSSFHSWVVSSSEALEKFGLGLYSSPCQSCSSHQRCSSSCSNHSRLAVQIGLNCSLELVPYLPCWCWHPMTCQHLCSFCTSSRQRWLPQWGLLAQRW